MLCLVKDLTCVGPTLPNSMMHVLVLFLASRAQRRLHQPCSVSPLLRPARRRGRCQQHASGCMQALCSKNLSCWNNVVRSAPPSKLLDRSSEGLHQSSIPTSSLVAPSVAFRVFPGCVPNGNPIVLQECNNDSLQVSPHILPTRCWTFRHHRRRNFCPDLPSLGPDSVVVFPKYEPLLDEVTRDLDCWLGVWMQECASTSAAAFVRACLIHVGGPPFHKLSAPMLPFSMAVHWLASRCASSRSSLRLGPSLGCTGHIQTQILGWMCMSCLARVDTTCLAMRGVVAMTTDFEATASMSSRKSRTSCNAASTALLTTPLGEKCVRSSTHCAVVVGGCNSCDFYRMS